MKYKEIVDYWFKSFKDAHKITPKWGAKEGKLLKDLLVKCEEDKISQSIVLSVMDYYHGITDGYEAEDAMWNFGIFVSNFEKYYLLVVKDQRKENRIQKEDKTRKDEYKKQQDHINSNYKTESKTVEDMAARLKERYDNDLSPENLKRAIRAVRMFKSSHERIQELKKKTAKAIVSLWGRDAYIAEWTKQDNPAPPSKDRMQILQEQARKIQNIT